MSDARRLRTTHIRALLLALAASACATSQKPAPAPAGPSSFLWKATMDDAPGTVYVLGSVHFDQEDARLDRAITDAVTAADHLVFEIDFDLPQDEITRWFIEKGLYGEGESLDQAVKPETLAALRAFLEKNGLKPDAVMKMRPWFLSITLPVLLMQRAGYSPDGGIDRMVHRLGAAEASKARQTHALETPRFQAELMMALEPLDADALVMETLRSLEAGMIEKLFDFYRKGDEAALTAFLQTGRESSPEAAAMFAKMIDDRNAGMLQGIMPFFQQDAVTVVTVGASHVVGAKGLLALLEEKGATVVPVPRAGPVSEDVAKMLAPKVETYRADGGGFEIAIAANVTHVEQQVPVGQGRSTRLDLYQASLTADTILMIGVTVMPVEASLPPEMLERVARQTLTGAEVSPAKQESTTVGSLAAVKVSGAGEGRSGTCWVFSKDDRLFSVMSLVTSPEPDPKGAAKMDAILASFTVVAPKR